MYGKDLERIIDPLFETSRVFFTIGVFVGIAVTLVAELITIWLLGWI